MSDVNSARPVKIGDSRGSIPGTFWDQTRYGCYGVACTATTPVPETAIDPDNTGSLTFREARDTEPAFP